MVKILFVCNQNKLRSPTAEKVFVEYPNVAVDSAGLYDSATKVLDSTQVEWADLIFVMDKNQLNRLKKKFKKNLNVQRIICLDILDEYEYMDPELINLLKQRVTRYLVPK